MIGLLLTAALMGGAAEADFPELRDRDIAAQSELEPRLELIREDHPRIFCTSEEIDALRQRIADEVELAEVWSWIEPWAKGRHIYQNLWASPSQLQACVIAYRVSDQDPGIFTHAIALADHLAEAEGDSWTWPRIAKGLAMAYDWLYDDLTPAQKQKYGEASLRAARECYKTWRHSEFNNHLYLEYGPILYTGIALHGEGIDDETARRLALDGLDLLVNRMMPAHDTVTRGQGGWHESMSYHSFFTYEFAQLIELWSSATGENLWAEFSGLDGDAEWLIHNSLPLTENRVSVADIGGFDSYEENIAAYLVLLQRRRGDGVAGDRARRIKDMASRRHNEGRQYQLGEGQWWSYLLWYDPTVPNVAREDLPLQRHFEGIGWVNMRESWAGDATFGLFICAPLYLGGHQHLDNNSFIIHKYGTLAVDSGVYDTANNHRARYYARSIAHNTVTVTDPDEQFSGATWGGGAMGEGPNDGGQLYGGAPDFVREVHRGDQYHRAEIIDYEATDEYVLTVGDATKSYSADKLREFTRAFLYVRPNIFIVFDRVESTNADFKKRWLLHTPVEPRIDGNRVTAEDGGRLTVETLFPTSTEVVSIGGPGREFEVDGINYAPEKDYDPGQAGRWRIEISPSEPAERDYFVHVLATSDGGTDYWPEAEVSETDEGFEVSIDGRAIVTFMKTGDEVVEVLLAE